jgi:hypothetical protein
MWGIAALAAKIAAGKPGGRDISGDFTDYSPE